MFKTITNAIGIPARIAALAADVADLQQRVSDLEAAPGTDAEAAPEASLTWENTDNGARAVLVRVGEKVILSVSVSRSAIGRWYVSLDGEEDYPGGGCLLPMVAQCADNGVPRDVLDSAEAWARSQVRVML